MISDTPAIRSGIGTNPSSSLNNPSPEAGSVGNNPGIPPLSSAARVREELEQVTVNPAENNPVATNPEGLNLLWSPSGEVNPEDSHPGGSNPVVTNPVDQLEGQNQAEGNPILFNIIPIPLEDPNWDTTPGTPAVTPSASPRSGPSSPRGSPPPRSLPGIFFNTFGTSAPISTPQPPVIPQIVTPIQVVPKNVTTPPSGRTTAGTTTPRVTTVPIPIGVRVPTGLPTTGYRTAGFAVPGFSVAGGSPSGGAPSSGGLPPSGNPSTGYPTSGNPSTGVPTVRPTAAAAAAAPGRNPPHAPVNPTVLHPLPLVLAVMEPKLRVQYPHFKGKRHEDPDLYLAAFENAMLVNGENPALKARLFPATLKQGAFAWYSQLEPYTQQDWDEVKNVFLEQFRVAQRDPDIMYQIQNMKQGERESIKEYLIRFRLMLRRLEVTPTDAQKITWLRNAVHQRFINPVEDRGYINADDFEDKLRTCAYSMSFRDGAFSNERDAYRRSDQNSDEEQSDDSTGTKRKKRQARDQKLEQKLVDQWKKALSALGSNAIYVELKRNASVLVMTREMRKRTEEPEVVPDSIPEDELPPLRRWDKEDEITKDTIDFIKGMQTTDEQEEVDVGEEAENPFIFTNIEEPDAEDHPEDTSVPENGFKRNRRRKTDEVTPSSEKRVRFSQTTSTSQVVEKATRKVTEKFLQQKADLSIQELFDLAPYCKEYMIRKLMDLPEDSEGTNPDVNPEVPISSITPWMDTGPVVQVMVKGMMLSNILIDGGSGANVISAELYSKLKGVPLHPAPFNLKMADQRRVLPMGMVKRLPIRIKTMYFFIDAIVLPASQTKGSVPMILGRPWLRQNYVRQEWALEKDFVELVWKGERRRISTRPMCIPDKASLQPVEVCLLNWEEGLTDEKEAMLQWASPTLWTIAEIDIVPFVKFKDPTTKVEVPDKKNVRFKDNKATVDKEEGEELKYPKTFSWKRTIVEIEDASRAARWLQTAPASETVKEKVHSHTLAPEGTYEEINIGTEEDPKIIKVGNHLSEVHKKGLIKLLTDYKGVFAWTYEDMKGIPLEICQHKIKLLPSAKPLVQRPYRMNPNYAETVRKEIEKLKEADFIYPVKEYEWLSPNVIVPKKNGKLRVCVDYRKLNEHTVKDSYAIPFIDDILDKVAGKDAYTFMDGYSGYNQVSIADEDQRKTAFITPWGAYAYARMPFGLSNAPATFQRLVIDTFADYIGEFMEAFLDDFTVSGDAEKHLEQLEKALVKCLENQLSLNPEKCVFWVQSGILLGHIICREGILMDPSKVEKIRKQPPPTNRKELQRVMGMANFYRRYILNYAVLAAHVNALNKENIVWNWTKECQEAFDLLKQKMSEGPILRPPRWDMIFHIHTDASGVAVGVVLAQPQDPKLDMPIYFASRTLNKSERDYTTTEREALAMVYAVKKCKSYLQGNKFVFFVDHQALTYLVNKVHITGRIARWLLLLQEFDFTVVYKSGKINVLADQLSRIELGREPEYEDDSFPDEHLLNINLEVPDEGMSSGNDNDDSAAGDKETYEELLKRGWQTPLRYFLAKGRLPDGTPYHIRKKTAQKIRQYTLINGELYKKGIDLVLRRCVNEEDIQKILEEAHEGPSGGHGAGDATA
ncbi:hypothetical protein R1sor_002885 [Riccia sorocarpa]|uniref:Reverse transcriptase domain-containing protein n=1 Tax=Riccia sorocarpa TaxID=122646 RepID=A0ABD3H0V4_9MARC